MKEALREVTAQTQSFLSIHSAAAAAAATGLHCQRAASSTLLPLSETACSSAIKGRRRWDRTLARGSHSFTVKDTSGSEDKAKKKDRERVAFLAELREEALDSRFPKHTQPSLPQRRNNNTIRIRPSSHLNRSCLGGLFLPPSLLRP